MQFVSVVSRLSSIVTMSILPVFVDLQGFIVREKFVVKEIAVLRDGCVLTHYLFYPPMEWNLLTRKEKSKACWLTANHHNLRWTDGVVDYSLAKRLIKDAVYENMNSETHIPIYVKGTEKIQWLKNIIGGCVNDYAARIETIDADFEDVGRLEMLHSTQMIRCPFHLHHCAMSNVWKLYNW